VPQELERLTSRRTGAVRVAGKEHAAQTVVDVELLPRSRSKPGLLPPEPLVALAPAAASVTGTACRRLPLAHNGNGAPP
jgi:hypothetical protein